MITYLIKPLLYYFCCCPNPQRAIADLEQDQPFQDALELVIQKQVSNNTPILHTDAIYLVPNTLAANLPPADLRNFGTLALRLQSWLLKKIRHYEANQAFDTISQGSRVQRFKSMPSQIFHKKFNHSVLKMQVLEDALESSLYTPVIVKYITEYTYYTTRDEFVRNFVSFPYLQLQRYCEWYNRYGAWLLILYGIGITGKGFLHIGPMLTFDSYTSRSPEQKRHIPKSHIPLFHLLLEESTNQVKEKFKEIMIDCKKKEIWFITQKITLDYEQQANEVKLKKEQYTNCIKLGMKLFDTQMLQGIQENKDELLLPRSLLTNLPSLLEENFYLSCQGISSSVNYAFYLGNHLNPVSNYIISSTGKKVYNDIKEVCFFHKREVMNQFFIGTSFNFIGLASSRLGSDITRPILLIYAILLCLLASPFLLSC